jgi:hypothetical protein
VTSDEIIDGVLGICLGGEETLERDLHQLREGLLNEVDKDVALAELFMLRICLAVYSLQRFFNAAAQQEIRDTFNRALYRILLQPGDERINAKPNVVIDEMNTRCNLYLEAINAPHHLGPSWNVGNVFSKLCGHERDPRVAVVASTEFSGAIISVIHFLTKCKPMDDRELIDLPESEEG